MGVLLLFFDGVGIAPHHEQYNPVSRFAGQPFPLADEPYDYHHGKLFPTDATLGLEGLPQSATGQTSILTGQNAAQIQGRHVNAFPTSDLRRLVSEQSIMKQIVQLGKKPIFANAYHAGYFTRKHSRFSVSTWSWLAAGVPYHNLADLHRGDAVSHDLTNQFLKQFGFGVPIRQPAQTGAILVNLLRRYDFVFFEYILTDVYGHRQDFINSVIRLRHISVMMDSLLDRIDTRRHSIILTSDHGNMEDLSTNTHTLNPVPSIVWGRALKTREPVLIRSLTDIAPLVIELLREA